MLVVRSNTDAAMEVVAGIVVNTITIINLLQFLIRREHKSILEIGRGVRNKCRWRILFLLLGTVRRRGRGRATTTITTTIAATIIIIIVTVRGVIVINRSSTSCGRKQRRRRRCFRSIATAAADTTTSVFRG